MLLHVDDFGCAPDGRVFGAVEIDINSGTVLRVPGATLRGTDVGKNIAIPGAADLHATIAKLPGAKTVRGSIDAGENLVTVLFEPGQSHFTQDHKGWRITVEGAGPLGTALLADVDNVNTGGAILTLNVAASTTVAGAVTVVNDPIQVLLSNHARASIGGITVELEGRSINDGKMVVGSEKLTSETAKFSSLDLAEQVTITGAGLFVTTIQSVDSPTQATLSAPAQRGVDGGPADIWQTDSQPGFQQLLSSLERLDVEAVEIVFDTGVYDFSRVPGKGTQGGVELDGLRNVTLRGSGPGVTILRLLPNQDLTVGDTSVIELRNCENIIVRDLSVHGSHLTMGHVNEQMHGIEINEGCENITVERVRVFQATGDGLRMRGFGGDSDRPEPNKVRRVWVEGCSFVQNKRTGVAFQRALEFVWLRNCYIEMRPPSTDSCIDFEPSGKLAPTDVIIDSNFLVHRTPSTAVSISGISRANPVPTDLTRRVKFINNILHGGGLIGGVGANEVTLAHNTIIVSNAGPAIRFRGDYSHLRVESNRIVATGEAHIGISVSQLRDATDHVLIANNHIEASGDGILLENLGSHVDVSGNRIFGHGPFVGIRVNLNKNAVADVHRDFKIDRNTIADFTTVGIQLKTGVTTKRFDGVSIDGNEIYIAPDGLEGGLVGIGLTAESGTDRWLENAVVSGNRISANIQVKIERDSTVPFVAISGNAGARSFVEGDGDDAGTPEGVVEAPMGCLFVTANSTPAALYFKQTGDGNTGWVRISP